MKTIDLRFKCEEVLGRLIAHAYSEIEDYNIEILIGKTQSYAEVYFSTMERMAEMKINHAVEKWRDPELTGLLAHELSHIVLTKSTEEETDLDVISRGLGIYLAIERIASGRYMDHTIRKSKDRYLGYSTIRQKLSREEERDLNLLLGWMSIIPVVLRVHDKVREKMNQRYPIR